MVRKHAKGDAAPVRVAVLDDYEIVERGVAMMLAPFADRVEVVRPCSGLVLCGPVDIVLHDPYAAAGGYTAAIAPPSHGPMARHTVLYTWAVTKEVVDVATSRHMSGVLSKALGGAELVEALERIREGERVIAPQPDGYPDDAQSAWSHWPGKAQRLTLRQSQIIALIASGLSNNEIAKRCYLSPNSVKAHIRAAYRTMGVRSRSQAVLWGVEHGFRAGHVPPGAVWVNGRGEAG